MISVLRIAHTVSSLEHRSSGVTVCVLGLARAQAMRGASIELFSLGRADSRLDGGIMDRRYSRPFAGMPILGQLGVSVPMWRAVRQSAVDIIQTHGLWTLQNVIRNDRACFVVTPHGMLTDVALSFSRHKKALFGAVLQNRALAAAALFHATAESEYDDIRRFGLRQPVAIIPNGIDLPMVADRPPIADRRTVLSLGRIHPKKGLDSLIRAWSEIEPAFPAWRLRLVGPDEAGHAADLQALVQALGLRSVTIEPPVFGAEKDRLMAGADLFVLPTRSENFAMTVAESLAVGVPVISTIGAPWRGLETHGCGWWINHGPDAMAAALRLAMALPDAARAEMGARGRDWMARDFSWDRMAQMSLDAYAWLLGRGSRPDFVHAD